MKYMSLGIREDTKHMLDILKKEQGAKSYDELLKDMAARSRGSMLEGVFGIAPGVGNFKRNKDEFERF